MSFFSRKNKTELLLQKVVFHAFIGTLIGVLLGFAFGWLVGLTSSLFAIEAKELMAMGVFFGMGSGAVLGAIFGGAVGYNK